MQIKARRPWFKVAAIVEDKATNQFFAIIRYRDLDDRMRRKSLALADLDDRKTLVRTLKNFGAYFSNEGANKCALAKLGASRRKAKRLAYAAQVGWCDGYRAFVLPDRVLGAIDEMALLPPRLKPHGHGTGSRGDHAEWVRTVAAQARFSSRMVFAISAALASPLLRLAKLPSFGILVYGPSKVGKSTMLLAAASTGGYGREQDLPNFRSTDAAFGEIPASFNDSLLPPNELSLLKGSATEKYQRLRDLAYGFAEGRGTTYSQLAPIAEARRGLEWLSILLATGEVSSNEIAREARETRMGGESIRWIDLAATRNGAADIFDRIPKSVPAAERARWAERRCATIRTGCRRNHGVAIEQFIEQVIENRKTVQKKLKLLRKTFMDRVLDDEDNPVVRHLAKCFGHIYAAAVIGVRFGTLPWSVATVRKCIERCYRDARRELNTETNLLRAGLKILRAKIRALPKSNGASLKYVDGFLTGNKRQQATIRAEVFKGWFPDARQPSLVLRSLCLKEALPSHSAPKSGIGIVWAESQPVWPDSSRPRSIVIKECPGMFRV